MQLLNQSAFLQSLGWAIANSLWQMAALWLCYQAVFGLHKKAGAAVKNLTATVLLFAGTAWFFYGFIAKYNSLQNELVLVLQSDKLQNQQQLQGFANAADNVSVYFNTIINFLEKYIPYLSSAYLMVFCFLFVRLLYAWYQCRTIKTTGLVAVEKQWAVQLEQLAAQAGIFKNIKLWFSEKVDVPATIGFIKPVILMPVALLNQLTPEQAETILLHELAHIKRHDYLINLLVAFSETILFFNPFAVLLSVYIKKERENSCDDFVLQFRNQPETYARALLALEQNRLQTQPLLLKATGNDGQLLHRVKRILNVPVNQFNYVHKLFAFLATAAILISLAWIKPANRQQQAKKSLEQNSIVSKEAGKIVLSPSSIEKRAGGDIVLFDERKKNPLLVKIEKDKIKLVDELNNIEINADDLEWEKLAPLVETPASPDEALTLTVPLQPETAIEWNNKKQETENRQFKMVVPDVLPGIKMPVDMLRRQFGKKHTAEMNKALEEMKNLSLVKEWENIPNEEDWKKMQEEIARELERANIKIKLSGVTLSKIDSALSILDINNGRRRISFDALRLQKEQQVQALIQLKQMAEVLKEQQTDEPLEEKKDVDVMDEKTEYAETPVIIYSGEEKKASQRITIKSPKKEWNKRLQRPIKRPAVIVSL